MDQEQKSMVSFRSLQTGEKFSNHKLLTHGLPVSKKKTEGLQRIVFNRHQTDY